MSLFGLKKANPQGLLIHNAHLGRKEQNGNMGVPKHLFNGIVIEQVVCPAVADPDLSAAT